MYKFEKKNNTQTLMNGKFTWKQQELAIFFVKKQCKNRSPPKIFLFKKDNWRKDE